MIADVSIPGCLVVLASIAGFVAHEPLLVAAGHRGQRSQRSTPAAKGRLAALLAITFGCGLTALALGSTEVRIALLGCAALATSCLALGLAGRHRTLVGQLWGVVTLSAACVPILLAGGITPVQTLAIWTAWLIGFAATTLAVRGVIAAQKRRGKTIYWSAILALILLTGVLTATGDAVAIATLPMLIMSCHLLIKPPPARHLKRVGWTLVVGTIATAGWMFAIV
ncbi:YwiC-like family protein [Rhodopirellula sp. ICT_H3.1]|uniref:YwiC-like family protein n=1 Tax=Aporhodopirellula aestuarii TaxID=2950107 RepID=A0ABT0U6S6_9BACT|nr:YwiC-like family protein [Aporhodopirellula aestuarii]